MGMRWELVTLRTGSAAQCWPKFAKAGGSAAPFSNRALNHFCVTACVPLVSMELVAALQQTDLPKRTLPFCLPCQVESALKQGAALVPYFSQFHSVLPYNTILTHPWYGLRFVLYLPVASAPEKSIPH